MTTKVQRELTNEMFNELIKEDKWIHEITYPVKCCDSNGNFKHYRTCTYPVDYIVTEEQIAIAKEHYARRRQEVIDGIKPGELVFVSMGMNYDSTDPDDICNHRIRCNFKNLKGESFFVEFVRGMKGETWVDALQNNDLEKKHNEDMERVFRHNSDVKRRSEFLPFPKQYYRLTHLEKKKIEGCTWAGVIRFINDNLGCNYLSARKLDYFVCTEDFINVCH